MSDFVVLPSNSDAEKLLQYETPKENEKDEAIQIGMNYITLFLEGDSTMWYISLRTKQNNDGTYTMDHLHRSHKGSNLIWKLPSKPDKDNLKPESIIDCAIDGKMRCVERTKYDLHVKKSCTY